MASCQNLRSPLLYQGALLPWTIARMRCWSSEDRPGQAATAPAKAVYPDVGIQFVRLAVVRLGFGCGIGLRIILDCGEIGLICQ